MRTIQVFDLFNRAVSEPPHAPRPLDVPKSFARRTPAASFDARSRVRCVSGDGKALVYVAFTTPLSSRAAGEECLVADRAFRATAAPPGNSRLSALLAADPGAETVLA